MSFVPNITVANAGAIAATSCSSGDGSPASTWNADQPIVAASDFRSYGVVPAASPAAKCATVAARSCPPRSTAVPAKHPT